MGNIVVLFFFLPLTFWCCTNAHVRQEPASLAVQGCFLPFVPVQVVLLVFSLLCLAGKAQY